jgi:hypothetical protein
MGQHCTTRIKTDIYPRENWLHLGTGNLDKLPENGTCLPVCQVFDDRYSNISLKDENKPHCLWFSLGTKWLEYLEDLYDPNTTEEERKFNQYVLMTTAPSNILHIRTAKDMNSFVKKYYSIASMELSLESLRKNTWLRCIPKISMDEKNLVDTTAEELNVRNDVLEKIPDKFIPIFPIEWDNVRKSNYYGVAFYFSSVSELGLDPFAKEYYWYTGFDVPSLCIWDLRALSNLTSVYI